MTELEGDSRAISVAELLARNGQRVGSGSGGRRRRGVKGGISVAELTGEFTAVGDPHATEPKQPEAPAEPEVPAEPEAPAQAERPAQPSQPERPDSAEDPAVDATAVFTVGEAADAVATETATEAANGTDAATDGADTKIAEKAPEVKPDPVDTPTVAAPAVTPTARATDSADAARTTVLPVSRPTPPPRPEPALFSGQTVAGDLLRQGGELSGDLSSDLDAEDLRGEDLHGEDLTEETEPSSLRQWAVLLGQGAVAVVAGALMFKGFERLWDMLPMVALVLAVLVIVGLVAMVRILRRTDDIASLVIAVVAGVFVTLGPLAFLLSTS